MKKSLPLALVLLLVPASVAAAETNSFKTTTRDKAGTVTFKVKTGKKGIPVKVTDIKASDYKTDCIGEDDRKDGPTVGASLKDTKPRLDRVYGLYRFRFTQNVGGRKWDFFGLLDKKGRKLVKGQLNPNFTLEGRDCNGTADLKPTSRQK